ncbi:MAG: glycosyltransferase family 4 protein [Candidatus Hodarchaeota archaeon]
MKDKFFLEKNELLGIKYMNILLITDDFYPNLGGVSQVSTNIYKSFKTSIHNLYVINPYSECENVFKTLERKNFKLKDLRKFLFDKHKLFLIFLSFWKILTDKRTHFDERIKIFFHLILRPKLTMLIIHNLNRIYPLFKQLKIDLILSGNSGWILCLNFILSRILNKKIVTIAHGNDFLIRSPLSLKTFYFKNIDKVIVTNRRMKEIIKKMHHLKDKNLSIINLGINPQELLVEKSKEELRTELKVANDKFIILSVGRHNPRKRFDLVIEAINNIRNSHPNLNLKYLLIGEGEKTEYLKKLTRTLNLEKYIEFLGPCDNERRNKFYKLSDLFIMPSSTKKTNIEGFGIVFLEANYFKLPVIGTKAGGISEAIIDEKTGFLIKPDDLNELISKIMLFYNNPQKRIDMGEYGYNRVIKKFVWNKIIQDYLQLFKELIE